MGIVVAVTGGAASGAALGGCLGGTAGSIVGFAFAEEGFQMVDVATAGAAGTAFAGSIGGAMAGKALYEAGQISDPFRENNTCKVQE